MTDEKLRRVRKEFELRINEFDFPVLCGLDILLRRGWEYYDNYSGTILAVGKVAEMPYYLHYIELLLDHSVTETINTPTSVIAKFESPQKSHI